MAKGSGNNQGSTSGIRHQKSSSELGAMLNSGASNKNQHLNHFLNSQMTTAASMKSNEVNQTVYQVQRFANHNLLGENSYAGILENNSAATNVARTSHKANKHAGFGN